MSNVSKSVDVVVIGGGVAGAIAAAKAASSGQRVVLVQHAHGATIHSSGAVDVGHSDDPAHPYRRVAAQYDQMDDALKLLGELASDLPLTARDDGQDHLLITQMGTLKRSRLVQKSQSVSVGDLTPNDILGVVQFRGLPNFDADAVCQTLRASLRTYGLTSIDVVPVTVYSAQTHRSAIEMALHADWTDLNQNIQNGMSMATIQPTHLLFPAVLGLSPLPLLQSIEQGCGVRAAELLAMPHSVPGMRLSRALENALAGRGVEVVTDRIVGYEMSNGRVTALRGSSRWMCEKVILATGRVLGGGIVSEAGVTRERIFGLPIWAGGRPIADRFTGDLTGQSVDATHELFRAGVAYDDKLRPLNEFGEIFATNVYAAGSILGGYDPAQDFTGIGVAAWTGYLAGNSLA